MKYGKVAFAAAVALATSSMTQAAPPPPEPASEHVEGAELRTTYVVIGGIVTLALLIYLVGTLLDNDTNAVPLSP